jgi:hypothetical protein
MNMIKVISLFCFFFISLAQANELYEVLLVKSKEISSYVKIVEVDNLKYLISVGSALFDPEKPKSRLNAMRLAKLKAEDNAVKFFRGSEVKVNDHLKEISIDGISNEENKTVLHEKAGGESGVYKLLGSWIDDDEIFISICYEIN